MDRAFTMHVPHSFYYIPLPFIVRHVYVISPSLFLLSLLLCAQIEHALPSYACRTMLHDMLAVVQLQHPERDAGDAGADAMNPLWTVEAGTRVCVRVCVRACARSVEGNQSIDRGNIHGDFTNKKKRY